MAYLNNATILGNVGGDPEMRTTKSGEQVANFSVATTRKWKKDGEEKDLTTWHNISVFGKLAEFCGQYVKKGAPLFVSGELRTDTWDKDGVKHYKTMIVANNVQLLSRATVGSEATQAAAATPHHATDTITRPPGVKNYAENIGKFIADEEIPF